MSKRKGKIMPHVREPSGRLSRSTSDAIEAVAPAAMKRLRDAAARGMADPEWGSELGRLFLDAKITAPEYEAGKRWGRLVRLWHRATGAPPPYPGEGPVAFLGTVRSRDEGDDPPVDSPEGKKLRGDRRRVIEDMQNAHAALMGAGRFAEVAVRATCEENEMPVGLFGLNNLRNGLRWLASFWGLTKD